MFEVRQVAKNSCTVSNLYSKTCTQLHTAFTRILRERRKTFGVGEPVNEHVQEPFGTVPARDFENHRRDPNPDRRGINQTEARKRCTVLGNHGPNTDGSSRSRAGARVRRKFDSKSAREGAAKNGVGWRARERALKLPHAHLNTNYVTSDFAIIIKERAGVITRLLTSTRLPRGFPP